MLPLFTTLRDLQRKAKGADPVGKLNTDLKI